MDEIEEILQRPRYDNDIEVIAFPAQLSCIWTLEMVKDYENNRRTPKRRLLKKDADPKIIIIGRNVD